MFLQRGGSIARLPPTPPQAAAPSERKSSPLLVRPGARPSLDDSNAENAREALRAAAVRARARALTVAHDHLERHGVHRSIAPCARRLMSSGPQTWTDPSRSGTDATHNANAMNRHLDLMISKVIAAAIRWIANWLLAATGGRWAARADQRLADAGRLCSRCRLVVYVRRRQGHNRSPCVCGGYRPLYRYLYLTQPDMERVVARR